MILYEKIKRAVASLEFGRQGPSTPEQDWARFESWRSKLRTDRVRMSPFLSAFVSEMVAHFPEVADPRAAWQAPYVAKFGILPLIAHWSESTGLLPDGSVRNFCTDPELHYGGGYEGLRKVDEGQTKADAAWNFLVALQRGAHAYPPLRPIVPARPKYMRACPVCLGSGGNPEEPHPCQCMGLGWALAESGPRQETTELK